MEKVKWNFKEKELQRVWATIADGVYSSSRSKAAQIRSPVLRYVHKALANTFFARKAPGHQRGGTQASTRKALSVGGLITPILCAAGVNPTDRRATEPGWMDIKFCKTNLLIEHKELDGSSNSSSLIHWLDPPSFSCPTQSSPQFRGENIDFRPPVYTLVGHEADLQEEAIELRLKLRIRSRRV
ncbi:unnamed protein product [Microthlaspi erraticum]|uniref:Arabidopsis retrotransposon Orf1 C-terminal domain-containing protein n=1 Tax=Microthlaspi erraticum TaxID=1685480 RepID=A0A6D2K1T9_9BRAS|nr:unnamed protein product [Microthlaspi erraticum]